MMPILNLVVMSVHTAISIITRPGVEVVTDCRYLSVESAIYTYQNIYVPESESKSVTVIIYI